MEESMRNDRFDIVIDAIEWHLNGMTGIRCGEYYSVQCDWGLTVNVSVSPQGITIEGIGAKLIAFRSITRDATTLILESRDVVEKCNAIASKIEAEGVVK